MSRNKPRGLKAPTAKSMTQIQKRLMSHWKLLGTVAAKDAMNTGKMKPTTGYNPKTGMMVREAAFDEKRFNQINKSFMSGKPQTQKPIDVKSATLGNRMRRIDSAVNSPKNKVIRTMGKVIGAVKASSVVGAISYALSITPTASSEQSMMNPNIKYKRTK